MNILPRKIGISTFRLAEKILFCGRTLSDVSYLPPTSPINPDLEDESPARIVLCEVVVRGLHRVEKPQERCRSVVGEDDNPANSAPSV